MPTTGIRGEELAEVLLEMSDELEARFRAEFLRQVSLLSKNKALLQLLAEIESGAFESGDPIDVRLNRVAINTSKLDEVMRNAIARSAKITQETIGIQGAFNVTNPEVINVARNLSVELSTNLNATARQTIRDIITDAVEGNITRVEAANRIRQLVGLIPQHAKAVENYYNKMLADGVKKSLAKKRAKEYAERLLRYRADTIARTEIARAVGHGQTEYWKQMRSEGFLPPEARRVWITAQDERVCPTCGPMNGVVADIDGFFDTGAGPVEYPQATHPRCRCTAGITIVNQKKRGGVSKSDETALLLWSISKANPYKDAAGRFTTKAKAVATGGKTISLSRLRRGQAKDPSSVRAFRGIPSSPRGSVVSDSEQKKFRATVESKARNGSSALLMPRDKKYGTAQTLPIDKAEKRYGSTVEEIAESVRSMGVEVAIGKSFLQSKFAKEEMLGVAQAVEEAKRMGIPVSNLRVVMRKQGVGDPDGRYQKSEGIDIPHIAADPYGGTIIMYSRGDKAASPSGIKSETRAIQAGGTNVEFSTSSSFLSESGLTPKQFAQRGAYGVFIHELGHHVTLNWAWQSGRLQKLWSEQGASVPSKYGRSDPLEMVAEGFAAWWLMGGSKNPTVKRYYKKWMPVTTYILAEDGLGRSAMKDRPQGYELLKADTVFDRGINIDLLPPDHPLIVWLTNGDSLKGIRY